eukprot:jgi/Botrbrau1/16456/Bobra.0142s0052.1
MRFEVCCSTSSAQRLVPASSSSSRPALRTQHPRQLCDRTHWRHEGGRWRGQLRGSLQGRQIIGGCSNGARWTAGQWLENVAEVEVAAPLETCWDMWQDRSSIPTWMPWIKSVKVLDEDARLSQWTLSTYQFNRDWTFTWVAEDLAPTPYQKMHWRSVQGSTGGSFGGALDIANRGQIRFYRKGPSSSSVKLTISYECPDVLVPLAGAVTPIVEGILKTDLQRFAGLAASRQTAQQPTP